MAITTTMSVHTISFRGVAGSIFICLTVSLVLYVIGFATTAWSINHSTNEGLWETCNCYENKNKQDWFHATQAFIALGLIGLLVSFILICIYMCVHTLSKSRTLLALVILCFITVVLMAIGFIIYGAKRDGLHWSFAITVISSIFCLVAGILSIVQMRESGVRI